MFYGYVNLMDDWEIDDENGLHMSFDLVEVEHVFKPLKSRADYFWPFFDKLPRGTKVKQWK